MLASRIGSFEGLRVADLFSGTGALGLEALSRGAERCLFVEKAPVALQILERNIVRLGAGPRSEVRAQGIEHAPPPARPCDLLFADPPYATGLAQIAIDRVADSRWLAPGAFVSIELSGEELVLPRTLELAADRRFGKARILLLHHGTV